MIRGGYFVTPHAVRRFRDRIRALGFDDAREAILASLASPKSVRPFPDRPGWCVRTEHPYRLRVVVMPPDGSPGRPLPAVTTVLRG